MIIIIIIIVCPPKLNYTYLAALLLHCCYFPLGIYTGNTNPVDETAFLTERHCLNDLVQGLKTPCPCGRTCNPWAMESIVQVSRV